MEDTSQVPQSEPACRGMPKLRSGRAAESLQQGDDAPSGPNLPSYVQTLPRQPFSSKLPPRDPLPSRKSSGDACPCAPDAAEHARSLRLDPTRFPSTADAPGGPKPRPEPVVSRPAPHCARTRAMVSHRRARVRSPSLAYK